MGTPTGFLTLLRSAAAAARRTVAILDAQAGPGPARLAFPHFDKPYRGGAIPILNTTAITGCGHRGIYAGAGNGRAWTAFHSAGEAGMRHALEDLAASGSGRPGLRQRVGRAQAKKPDGAQEQRSHRIPLSRHMMTSDR